MPIETPSGTTLPDQLFAMASEPAVQVVHIGDWMPALIVDDFYAEPECIRAAALALEYESPGYAYPGRIASLPVHNPSLRSAVAWIRRAVNRRFLPHAPLTCDGKPITAFDRIVTDMALTETHPAALADGQRLPHVDPVPVFGLVYLNRKQRGGTLFFERDRGAQETAPRAGYPDAATRGFNLVGRLKGCFNRLVIYPGIVPHSGEIQGDWISGEGRFSYPRLTQRFTFFPAG